jgi:hypothetical protein
VSNIEHDIASQLQPFVGFIVHVYATGKAVEGGAQCNSFLIEVGGRHIKLRFVSTASYRNLMVVYQSCPEEFVLPIGTFTQQRRISKFGSLPSFPVSDNIGTVILEACIFLQIQHV